MKKLHLCACFCGLILLQGCFDNSDNETKDNNDGTPSSVQMEKPKDR
jgi:hypothetical protein